MDPLSITASAITLIQATGVVATAIGSFINSMKTVDSRLTDLHHELNGLAGTLQAIEGTLKKCNTFPLDEIDERLWQQSELTLANCQTTLNEMSQLVERIKRSTAKRDTLWKARVVVDLSVHGDELVFYRDKIHQLSMGLQTMLQTIQVSLSLRTNATQELIFLQLSRLKTSIEEAIYASSRPIGGFRRVGSSGASHGHVSRNIRQLAEAAQRFHTTASSTAGTVRGSGSNVVGTLDADISGSVFWDASAVRKENVERYLTGLEPQGTISSLARGSRPPSFHDTKSLKRSSSTATAPLSPAAPGTARNDDPDDDDVEREIFSGFREIALDSMRGRNYEKAVKFLLGAISHQELNKIEGQDGQNLQATLALCYVAQHKWRQAEPIVSELRKGDGEDDIVICNLLHAFALGYLADYNFEDALKACKLALKGKRRLCKRLQLNWEEYHETWALLSIIYDARGDHMNAEVAKRQIPEGFKYSHPANEAQFIEAHARLLDSTTTHSCIELPVSVSEVPKAEFPSDTSTLVTELRPQPHRLGTKSKSLLQKKRPRGRNAHRSVMRMGSRSTTPGVELDSHSSTHRQRRSASCRALDGRSKPSSSDTASTLGSEPPSPRSGTSSECLCTKHNSGNFHNGSPSSGILAKILRKPGAIWRKLKPEPEPEPEPEDVGRMRIYNWVRNQQTLKPLLNAPPVTTMEEMPATVVEMPASPPSPRLEDSVRICLVRPILPVYPYGPRVDSPSEMLADITWPRLELDGAGVVSVCDFDDEDDRPSPPMCGIRSTSSSPSPMEYSTVVTSVDTERSCPQSSSDSSTSHSEAPAESEGTRVRVVGKPTSSSELPYNQSRSTSSPSLLEPPDGSQIRMYDGKESIPGITSETIRQAKERNEDRADHESTRATTEEALPDDGNRADNPLTDLSRRGSSIRARMEMASALIADKNVSPG